MDSLATSRCWHSHCIWRIKNHRNPLAFLAYGIHHSVGVPIAAFALSLLVYKRPQWAIYLWTLSIVVSLLLGNSLTSFIEQLSFDERLSHYTNVEQGGVGIQFSSYGFRWDFLLYSAMPIALGYYSIVKKRITDNWYSVLFTTYCFANAFLGDFHPCCVLQPLCLPFLVPLSGSHSLSTIHAQDLAQPR